MSWIFFFTGKQSNKQTKRKQTKKTKNQKTKAKSLKLLSQKNQSIQLVQSYWHAETLHF